jgi:CheY-like chemotaxis protein
MIGDYLKKADQYLKEENFDAAEREVRYALLEDPKNIYTLAYKERIRNARKASEERRKYAEEVKKRDEQLRGNAPKAPAAPKPAPAAPAPSPVVTPSGVRPPADLFQTPVELSPKLEQYRAILERAWNDGPPNPQVRTILEKARQEIHITQQEHDALESQMRIDAYLGGVREAWRLKQIVPESPNAFEELRKKFGVTVEQHLQVESRLLWELYGNRQSANILYIDDDVSLVEVVKATLGEFGYKTTTALSPEEAFQQMKNIVPDLILCDMRFPNSSLNGISIYEHVRKIPEFTAVPFVFLTAVKEENIVRTSLGLGVDDYITKPFTTEMLLATVEGKLRRYRELRKVRA